MKNYFHNKQTKTDWYSLHKNALKRPEIKNYFVDLLAPIQKEISEKRVLEIGAGSTFCLKRTLSIFKK
jgi:hypothetical protein